MQGDPAAGPASTQVDEDLAQLLQGINGTPLNRPLEDDVVPAVLTAFAIMLLSLIPILRPFFSFVSKSQQPPQKDIKCSDYSPPNLEWPEAIERPFVFMIELFSDGSEDDREYDRRFGIWRVLATFKQLNLPATVVVSCSDLQESPDLVRELTGGRFEVCMLVDCSQALHLWDLERIIDKCGRDMVTYEKLLGCTPKGLYLRKLDLRSRRLVHERFKVGYDANGYGDSPWLAPHLVVPNSTSNVEDMNLGFSNLFEELITSHASDRLCPRKLTSIEVPCSVFGKVTNTKRLWKALYSLKSSPGVYITTKGEIAALWSRQQTDKSNSIPDSQQPDH
uniref:Uncharacterized protein n=1 Tax=Guillardia theta TaxID=55529 RepID=A0A7S4N0K6_GUITH